MRTLAIFVAAFAALAGCAAVPHAPAYGNFVANANESHSRKMAADAARQVATLYPPARTRFNLQQPTPDAFGTALIADMRARGYALLESSPTAAAQPRVDSGAVRAVPPAPDTMSLSYVLDRPADLDLYRLTLVIGEKSLSRVYRAKDAAVAPAGSWVRKE